MGIRRDLLRGFLGEALLILGSEHLAHDLGRRVDHEPDHLVLDLGDHLVTLLLDGLVGLGDDVLGIGDGLLKLLLRNGIAAETGLFDQMGGFVVGLAKDLLVAEFSLGELLLDALGIVLAFLDSTTALVENLQDRSEGKFAEHAVNDKEQDDLGNELGPGDAEILKEFGDDIHENAKTKFTASPGLRTTPHKRFLATAESQDQGVNGDGFRQRHAENGHGEHASEGSRIATDGFSRLRSDESDANAGASARHTEGEATVRPAAAASARIGRIMLVILGSLLGVCVFLGRPRTCTVPTGKG